MSGRRFANAVLLAGALLALVGGLAALRTGEAHQVRTAGSLLVAAATFVLAAGLLAGLRLPPRHRINVAVGCLSLGFSAYVAEFCLMQLPAWQSRWRGSRLGLAYDNRMKVDVIRDMRRQGTDAWPSVMPWLLLDRRKDPGFLPLGSISRVVTVVCREIGGYLVYQSDERGFHNPTGLWSGGPIEVAALGDSMAQGACVPPDRNMVAHIRRRYPSTVNLGMSGDGPLAELATLREYLPALRPRRVLWLYYEANDLLYDVDRERRDALLMRYLDPAFRQHLVVRQAEIDAALKQWVDDEYWARGENISRHVSGQRWGRFLLLRTLRASLGLLVWQPPPVPAPDPSGLDYDLFRRIVTEARATVDGWGGRLYFVYLPAPGRYASAKLRDLHDAVRPRVLGIVHDTGVSLIDVADAFGAHPDVAALYTWANGHYTPEGYALAADAVLRALEPEDHRASVRR